MTAGAAAVRESLLDRLPRGNRAVAWIGVLLGLFAFFVELPPIAARSLNMPPTAAKVSGVAYLSIAASSADQTTTLSSFASPETVAR